MWWMSRLTFNISTWDLTLILHTGPVGGGNALKAGLQPANKRHKKQQQHSREKKRSLEM